MTVKGFAFDAGAGSMTFHRGGGEETLTIPDDFPVLLLPDEVTIDDQNAVFPDVSKDLVYTHVWEISGGPTTFSHAYQTGRVMVAALPQEWSQSTTLMAAPDDADIFAALVKLTRTVSPSHNWLGSAITKMVPENVWIPLTGSLLLETHLGFSRAMSIYISGGNLVLHQQQSIGVAPGGFGLFGSGEPSTVNHPSGGTSNGGETVAGTTNGWPVYYPGDTGPPHHRHQSYSRSEVHLGFGIYQVPQSFRKTGSTPPSITDPTNYGATWQVDIRGQFGRRS